MVSFHFLYLETFEYTRGGVSLGNLAIRTVQLYPVSGRSNPNGTLYNPVSHGEGHIWPSWSSFSWINFRKSAFLEWCLTNLFAEGVSQVNDAFLIYFWNNRRHLKSKVIYVIRSLGSGNLATVGMLRSSLFSMPQHYLALASAGREEQRGVM